MTTDQRFTLIIAFLTLIFAVMTAILGVGIRAIIKFTRAEERISNLSEDMKQLIGDKEKTHNEMLAQMRDDRHATDRRLRWLEENVWNRRGRTQGAL